MPLVPTVAFDYLPALPEIVLLIAACGVLLIDLFVQESRRHVSYWLTQLSIAATALATLYVFHKTPVRTFGNMFVADAFGDVLNFLSCLTVMLMLAYSRNLPRGARIVPGRDLRAGDVRLARHDGS